MASQKLVHGFASRPLQSHVMNFVLGRADFDDATDDRIFQPVANQLHFKKGIGRKSARDTQLFYNAFVQYFECNKSFVLRYLSCPIDGRECTSPCNVFDFEVTRDHGAENQLPLFFTLRPQGRGSLQKLVANGNTTFVNCLKA